MSSINTTIQEAIKALAAVKPETLTVDQLKQSRETLDAININDVIDNYWRSLPAKPENESDLSAWESQMREKGKEINHDLHQFNDELSRIKSIQHTLDLDALEPLIKSAQQVIRPLYNFTSQLNS
jgi:hypothetical protein